MTAARTKNDIWYFIRRNIKQQVLILYSSSREHPTILRVKLEIWTNLPIPKMYLAQELKRVFRRRWQEDVRDCENITSEYVNRGKISVSTSRFLIVRGVMWKQAHNLRSPKLIFLHISLTWSVEVKFSLIIRPNCAIPIRFHWGHPNPGLNSEKNLY